MFPEISQGSSFLATLGFASESLWDSQSVDTGVAGDGKSLLPLYAASLAETHLAALPPAKSRIFPVLRERFRSRLRA
jgi:hypothetical protein